MQAQNGPRHTIVDGLRLGSLIEFDPNGQPSALSDGDDLNRTDDEDGVAAPISRTVGQAAPVIVVGDQHHRIARNAGGLDRPQRQRHL